jgi:hypothetical protein
VDSHRTLKRIGGTCGLRGTQVEKHCSGGSQSSFGGPHGFSHFIKNLNFIKIIKNVFVLATKASRNNKISQITVELGYNDHGYNEFMAIKNNYESSFQVRMIILLHKPSRLYRSHGYNEQIFAVP